MTMFWSLSQIGLFDEHAPGHQPARHRRPLLRRLPSAPTASTCRSARSSRSSTPSCCASPGSATTPSSPSRWIATVAALKARLAEVFATKTRAEWCALMERTDVCFAPVLTHGRGGRAPAQRRPLDDRRRRRGACSRRPRRASAARPPRSACRRPTPASTPRGARATGVCPRTASTPSSIGSRRRAGRRTAGARWRRIVFVHAHPDDEASLTSGSMARAAARATASCWSSPPTAATVSRPTTSAPGETLVERRRTERRARRRCSAWRGWCGSATTTPG